MWLTADSGVTLNLEYIAKITIQDTVISFSTSLTGGVNGSWSFSTKQEAEAAYRTLLAKLEAIQKPNAGRAIRSEEE